MPGRRVATEQKNLRTKTIGGYRAVYDPAGDRRKPWLVEQRVGAGKQWTPVMTYGDGPARYAHREHAVNCAWNMDHFNEICSGRLKARKPS